MAAPSRYHVSAEATGVSNGILKNKLGINNQKQLENAEWNFIYNFTGAKSL